MFDINYKLLYYAVYDWTRLRQTRPIFKMWIFAFDSQIWFWNTTLTYNITLLLHGFQQLAFFPWIHSSHNIVRFLLNRKAHHSRASSGQIECKTGTLNVYLGLKLKSRGYRLWFNERWMAVEPTSLRSRRYPYEGSSIPIMSMEISFDKLTRWKDFFHLEVKMCLCNTLRWFIVYPKNYLVRKTYVN